MRCGYTCPTGVHRPPDDTGQHGTGDDHDHNHDDGDDSGHTHHESAPATPPAPIAMPGMVGMPDMPGMGGMPGMPGMGGMPGSPGALDICDAAREGYWELLHCDSKVLAVHAVLMHTGRVLFFAGSGNNVPRFNAHDVRSVVWDYVNGTYHTPGNTIRCVLRRSDRPARWQGAGPRVERQQYDPFLGLRSSWYFDPILEEWIRLGDMTYGRWYPSLLTLGDGRAMAVSGIARRVRSSRL